MKKHKLYLLAGLVLCSALFGLDILSRPTSAITAEEELVADTMSHLALMYDTVVWDNNIHHPEAQVTRYPEIWTLPYAFYESPDSLIFYKPESINAAIRLQRSEYITAVNNDGKAVGVYDLEDSRESLATGLADGLGFEKYPYAYYDWPEYYEFIDKDSGVICAVAHEVQCGHVSWWSLSKEWTTFLNGVGSAYYKANNEYPVVTENEGELPIYDSDYKSYQYARVNHPNNHSLLYRKSPTSDWIYFTSTQDDSNIDCSEYDEEATKGFAGTTCYDSNKQQIVKITVPESEESAIKVPDTGSFTGDEKYLAAGLFAASISIAGIVCYITSYIIKRQRTKVGFKK